MRRSADWWIKGYINDILKVESRISSERYYPFFAKGTSPTSISNMTQGIEDFEGQARNLLEESCTFKFNATGTNSSKIMESLYEGEPPIPPTHDFLSIASDTDFDLFEEPVSLTFSVWASRENLDIGGNVLMLLRFEEVPTYDGGLNLTGRITFRSTVSGEDYAFISIPGPEGVVSNEVNYGADNHTASANFKFTIEEK